MAQWESIHLPMQEMQGAQVRSLCWEDPLEEGIATHPSVLAWRIPLTEEPGSYSPWGPKELDMAEQMNMQHMYKIDNENLLKKTRISTWCSVGT